MGYSHGIKWTDEKIRTEILKVIECLKIDRMPTQTEILSVMNEHSLTNKIAKTKGYYGWANELGLEIKKSCTTYGKNGENFVSELLMNKGFEVKKMSQNYTYDLLLNDCCKIDVKSSKLYKGKKGNFYSFALAKNYPTCDFYILVAESDIKEKIIYIIPSKDVQQKQISIGEKTSVYTPYIDRFDFLKEYITAIKRIKVN